MKYQRIIYQLEDGRQKYSTRHGEIEQWTATEIESLRYNISKLGYGVFTADFSKFDFTHKDLRARYPKAKIVKIVKIFHEDYDLPLNPNIIF